jgi:hypothetical protein
MRVAEFYGPFTHWQERPEYVVLSFRHTANPDSMRRLSPEYPDYSSERPGFEQHVAQNPTAACPADPCYDRIKLLPGGGELLQLRATAPNTAVQ